MGEHIHGKSPLCVDLDGTLIRTDLLWESLLALLKQRPLSIFQLPFWLLKGRAYFKHQHVFRPLMHAHGLGDALGALRLGQGDRLARRALRLDKHTWHP